MFTLLRVPLVAAIVIAIVAWPAAAGARIKIQTIRYDPPGADSGSNSSLNQEWIALKNTGRRARQLRGWRIHDRGRSHVYRFRRFRLRPGAVVRVHTGRGSDTRRDLYWGLDYYVWNNDGDRATLLKRNGDVVDRCSYGGGGTQVMC